MMERSLLPVSQTKVNEEEQQQLKLHSTAGEQVERFRKVINKVGYSMNMKCRKMCLFSIKKNVHKTTKMNDHQ